jgi:hypothetical protein
MRYKQQIINTILNDYELVKLIDLNYIDDTDESTVDADDLIYVNIFPYYYNPDTIVEEKCFIFMTVDTPRVQDDLIKDMQITIIVVANQGLMKVPYNSFGTRIDQMGACVDRLFNGRPDIGFGTLSLLSNYEGSIDPKHRCRTLKFKVEDFNQSRCSQ